MSVNEFDQLKGQTCTSVRHDSENEQIVFELTTGDRYALGHLQDCCESVWIEDIVGELADLVGAPLLMAESVTNSDDPPHEYYYAGDSYTWTYIKFATIKGYVTVRFFGTSNGYYSESADLYQLEAQHHE